MDQPSRLTAVLNLKLERMRQGDPAARDELLRAVGLRLERLTRRMLRAYPQVHRCAETGDVLQNACMRLLRSLEAVQPKTTRDFFNLAAVNIRRELIDLARSYQGPLGIATREHALEDEPVEAHHDPLDMDLDSWERFHAAVGGLPAEQREVVSLVFYHGWQQQDVAELLQVNVRTVRRWWQAALARLSANLQPDSGEPEAE